MNWREAIRAKWQAVTTKGTWWNPGASSIKFIELPLEDYRFAWAARTDVPLLLDALEEAERILAKLEAGQGPCELDHHGLCQAHRLEEECSIAAARALLAKLRAPEGSK